MSHDTIPGRLFRSARLRPEAPALFTKKGSEWVAVTYREYAHLVRRAARALVALGFQAGETACILGFNRAEWVIFDVATMTVGGAPAGIYTTCSKEEVQYIVDHSGAPIVLVENAMQWEKVKAERHRMPRLRHVVTMLGAPAIDDPMVLSWEDFLAKGDLVKDAEIDQRLAAVEPGNLATLIYTSGTTGPPKGVMLSHRNLSWTADTAAKMVGGGPWDRSISYLPLSHIAEQVFTIHGPLTMGGSVYFAESIDKLMENIKDVRPTIFFGVPRIWEKMHSGIAAKLGEAKGVKKEIAAWARGVGAAVTELRHRGEEPQGALALQHRLARKLVFGKLRDALGLGSARVCVSGAAPIAKEVIEFFGSLDIPIHEVYGQSEDTGPTSFNLPGKTRLGTVGPIIPGVEVKIAEDGEILVKGPNVFLGYFKEPQATAETLIDGWLYSGDLGAIDRDGFLQITGRKKEIIITAGGKNIAPKNIEAALKNHPLVSEAVVIGDRRKYLTALVTLDPDAARKFLDERGPAGLAHEAKEIRDEIQRTVDEINATLARGETVKKFHILSRPFTIEHGELTPTLKVKRKIVYEHFADTIESMYRDATA